MNMTRRLFALLILAVSLLTLAPQTLVMAASPPPTSKDQIQTGINDVNGGPPPSAKTLNETITTGINLLSAVIGIVAVVMIIVSGLRFITSGGNPERVKSAKNSITYAAIGLLIVAMSQAIARFVLTK